MITTGNTVKKLSRFIPKALVKSFASPYVAGDSIDSALDVASELRDKNGIYSNLDLLAEDIDTQQAVAENLQTYLKLVDKLSSDQRFSTSATRPTLSIKLSSFTTAPLDKNGDGEGAIIAAEQIAEAAAKKNVELTIDMESHHWTSFTLDVYRRLWDKGHRHIGLVLQSRLFRSDEDINSLPEGCRVRMVIGIYNESKEIALTDKKAMKEKLLEQSFKLLERGHYLEFGTHDEAIIRRFTQEVVDNRKIALDKFEIQMLYGVPRKKLHKKLVARGIKIRLYVPFALSWDKAIAYLRRRLEENPEMAMKVGRNILGS